MADTGVQEEWSWSDSDGEGGDALDGAALASSRRKQASEAALVGVIDTGEHDPHANGRLSSPWTGGSDCKKSIKAGVRQMVALGLCSPQAAEMFLQIESDSQVLAHSPGARAPGASKDQVEATEARLAAAELALRESEEQQLKLQAELMRLTLNPYQDRSSSQSGGVTAFDVARAQREAEKVMTLQRKVAEGEERERQQATMQAKMEELLRLQEVALSEREEGFGSLEKELAERDAKLRLLCEQLLQLEQTRALEQQSSASEMAELKVRNAELEEGIVYRDEQLRRTDGEKLRLHEIQMEEKENQLRNLEARLAANGGDQLQTLKSTFSHTLEDRELRLATLEQDLKQVKAQRDDTQTVCAELQSTCRELRMESEHLQMALTIVEPKVHVLHSMLSDIQLHLQGQIAERDNKITSQQQHLDRTLPRMHGQMEEMKKGLGQRDTQINSMQHEIASLRNILKERESKIPEIQDALDKQRQVTMKQQEELLFKSQRIETLQSALEQMQFALDRTQNMMSEREARLQLLQASLDNSQPAMSIARKAIEERDMKLNAFQVLLHMGESQVQENVKALDQAMQSLKDKDENLKQLQAMIDERDLRIGDMETTLGQSRNEMAEKDWQINAHESKISDLHEKLHSIDREHASESVNQGVASASRMLNDSINDVTAPDDYDRVQVGALNFKALRSINFGEARDMRASVMRTLPFLADQELQNAPFLKGRIALIERGLCTFQEKAMRALAAGAVGIIFANTEDDLYQPVASATNMRDPTPIPILCIKKSDAAMLTNGMVVAMLFSEQKQASVAAPSIRASNSQHGTESGGAQPMPRQRVLAGAHLQEWTRGKHTGTFVAGDAFIQVTATAEVAWKNRKCRIKRVRDGFSKALSLAKPAESNSKCGFTIRLESDERVSDIYDLELMASSEQDKMHWIAGILELVKERLTTPKYTGERSSGTPKGKGLGEYPNGDQYMGEWESGFEQGTVNGIVPLPHGQGVFAWRNGDLYRGEWDKGVRSGFGTLETADGAIYQGQWEDDRISGSGIQVSASKEKYVGTFLEGFRHGPGVLTQPDGTKKYLEYSAGVETNKGPYPHTNVEVQASLVQMSKDSRESAKTAAEKAQAAQTLCQLAEGLIHQVSAASNPGSLPPPTTFSSLQRPAAIPPSIPSTPGSIRPVQLAPTNQTSLPSLPLQAKPAAEAGPFRSMPPPDLHSLQQAFPGSPITSTPQTPSSFYASIGPGTTFVQSPPFAVSGGMLNR